MSNSVRHALVWLADVAGIKRSLCLAVAADGRTYATMASQGFLGADPQTFTMSADDWRDPLARVINRGQSKYFPAPRSEADRRRRPVTPFGDDPLYVAPLVALEPPDRTFGVLMLAAESEAGPEVSWLVPTLRNKLGQILHWQSMIDAARRQERDSALLHSVIDAVPDPIVLTDARGRLLIANSRALALFAGSSTNDVRRRGAVRMNNMLLSSALSSDGGRGVIRRELLLTNPDDGSDLVFELSTAPTTGAPEAAGIVSVLRNVSDLRRASEEIEENDRRLSVAEAQARAESDRLNLIIDTVAAPILVTDATGSITLMNDPAERLFSPRVPATETDQRAIQNNDQQFATFIGDMLAAASHRRVGELALVEPGTGEEMPVEAVAGKLLSDQPDLTAIVTILHDRRESLEKARLIKQLKQASDELEMKVDAATADIVSQNELLRRQAIELEQASLLKSQFLANMSHEFRTPLNAMLGYTSMLLQGVAGALEPPVRRQLGRVESNGRHLLTIINEILDISRIEAGRMPLQISTFRIPDLVAEVKSELEPIIIRTRLDVRVTLPRDLKPLTSDRQKVKQILSNLLTNALKFTHDGHVEVCVRRSRNQRLVSIAVSDTGIGIAPADQAKIFEDFRQLDNSPTRAYGGTGLGLSICRRLATMLDGRLELESRLGIGSTFTLTLPMRGRR
jgi:signal transduction histidine kinase